jgi:hypothetical protein
MKRSTAERSSGTVATPCSSTPKFELLPQEGVGIFYAFNSRGQDNAVYGLRKALLDQFIDRYFPPAAAPPDPPTLASAAADAPKIAARYQTSRRVQHGFLSVLYLLQEPAIVANPDGTIAAPKAFGPGEAHLREVAPNVWREIGGTLELALRDVGGVKTVLDSEDPSSGLQQSPWLPVGSTEYCRSCWARLLVLALTSLLWPMGYVVRRHYQRALDYPAAGRRFRTLLRVAAIFELLWLACWTLALLPVLNVQVDFYSTAHDPLIRALQLAGVLLVALAAGGIWSVCRLYRMQGSWPARIGNGLIAAGLIGLVWIGFIGGLISFNLNY